MPPRSKVAGMPAEIKEWLDRALAENNFSDYELLAEELKARGYAISKSALHRYGQAFETRLSALKMASEQARAVVAAAPDEEGAHPARRTSRCTGQTGRESVAVDPKRCCSWPLPVLCCIYHFTSAGCAIPCLFGGIWS